MGDAFPRGPEEITTDWLSKHVGGTVGSFDVEQIGIGVGLLGRLYRLELSGDDVPASVIAKFPTLDEGARMNVVEPLNFYSKEVQFYNEAAKDTPIPTPQVYFASHDRESGDFSLLLEDLGDRRMCDQNAGCLFADAKVAVDAIVDLHATWWSSDRLVSMPWIPAFVEPPYPQVLAGMFKQSWPRALEVAGEGMGDAYKDFGDRFPELVEWFATEASRPPVTFCHGDYRLDNLFFGITDDHAPLTVVDWQICLRARGGYDMGYFVSQSLSTEDRRTHETALRDRYLEGIANRGIDYPEAAFDADYRRTTAWCFIYPVVATGQIEVTNERHRELVKAMTARAIQAIEDNDALELLPS
ncbi:MAG: phosphotransferase [Actinomycetota bacterium]